MRLQPIELSLEARIRGREPRLDIVEVLLEEVVPLPKGREGDAEDLMLALSVPGSETEGEASAGHDVEVDRAPEDDGGVAERDGGDHDPERDGGRLAREPGEVNKRVRGGQVGRAGRVVRACAQEVVADADRAEPVLLGPPCVAQQIGVAPGAAEPELHEASVGPARRSPKSVRRDQGFE